MYTVLSNRLARQLSQPPFLNANYDLANIAILLGVVARRPTQVQARLHPKDGFRMAHCGDREGQ
jgi:hypothetical protein